MGLFGGNSVSQVEFDNVNNDLKIVRFALSLEEMKSAHAIIFSDMKYALGKACGSIDAIAGLIEANLLSTASTVFETVENDIVANLNKAGDCHRSIIESMQGFSPEISAAYIAHLNKTCGSAQPLHEQVNQINDLLAKSCAFLKSIQQVLK